MCLCFLDLLQNLPDKSAESRSQPGDNNEISSRVYINFDGHKQSHKEIIISGKKKQNKQQRTMLDHHCHYLCRCMNHCLDHPNCLK